MKAAEIEFDEAKRRLVLTQRGLDFAEAGQVFSGPVATRMDDRRDYGEARYQTFGWLRDEIVMVVWTWRSDRRRIISMRRCHVDERTRYLERLGRPG